MSEKMELVIKINKEINEAVKEFNETKAYNQDKNASIIKNIEMLVKLTGKDYCYDENGVHER